jgi:CrcB protein
MTPTGDGGGHHAHDPQPVDRRSRRVLARYEVEALVPRLGSIPWGTFTVNITGAFQLGLFFTILVHRLDVPMWVQSAVLIGLLGGYTTFSTLSLELFLLIERGQVLVAVTYAVASITGGVIALLGGIVLGRAVT